MLEPFFRDNMALKALWVSQPTLLAELSDLSDDIDSGMFASQGLAQMSGALFNENMWTKRH